MIRVKPTLYARLKAEFVLRSQVQNEDTVLCFGNLPPLLRNQGKIFVYLQNRYLSGSCSLRGLPILARMRILLERVWIRACLRNSTVLVQTETMKQEVEKSFGRQAKVAPFLPQESATATAIPDKPAKFDYLYVASGEPHKNHRRLVEAWRILASWGFRPSLCLTLAPESDSHLLAWVEGQQQRYDLNISNHPVSPADISKLYLDSAALVYPSLFESFGLPLLEARNAGLPVIAAELDYVRDVINPLISFNPESTLSIARSILRHSGQDQHLVDPVGAESFLDKLLQQQL